MKCCWLVIAVGFGLLVGPRIGLAAPGSPPAGYQFTNISIGLGSTHITGINQMTFKPGDPTHLYASRGFSGVVTRYNYDAISGQLSNPLNIVDLTSVPDGMKVITGLGFYGNDMWITRWPGWIKPRPTAITRLRDGNNDGIFETRNDFVTGMDVGDHTINQIQIVGSSLLTGIGKNANTGNPAIEQVYNGTIGRIGDLNNPVAMNMTSAADRAAFANTSISDGRLRMYAQGFRNPYGLRITSSGTVMISDNGADAEGSFPETPDLFYKKVQQNDIGTFPPPGQPGAPTPTMTPITLGSHQGAAGFDIIPSGPDRGNVLLGLTSGVNGRRVAMVDLSSGVETTFISGFSTPTDVITDPFGRLLISDLNGNAVYLLTPPSDADANLDGIVDVRDLAALAMHWHSPASYAHGDFDRNGYVDAADLGLLASNWQDTSGTLAGALSSFGLPADAVPEPALAGACLLLLLGIGRSRSRRPVR